MLTHFHLKGSSSPGLPGLTFPLVPSITIFVGPNNSGKSLLLREIAAECFTGYRGSHRKVLDRIGFEAVDRVTAEADYEELKREPGMDENVPQGHSTVRLAGINQLWLDQHYFMGRLDPNNNPELFTSRWLAGFTLSIDGATRIQLIDNTSQGDLKNPDTPLARIYTNDAKREKWRAIVREAFDLYPGIDALAQGRLSVKFGTTPPPRERTHEDDVIEWMRAARDINTVSDGVKAFSGILLQVYAGDPKVILIDEPEAFLHPSLARALAKELANATRTENKYVFVATHSAEFVMGAIQSGAIVNIVRLTYTKGIATARLLPNAELVTLMNDPMLRSVGVLAGLFYDYVVVTEGDADRAFYQEINERLLDARDARAISGTLFLNADNKQTVPAIVAPLRKLGIPAAAAVDIDIVKDGGLEWTRQLDAGGVPQNQHQSLHQHRQAVLNSLLAAAPSGTSKPGEHFKINGGINLLNSADRASANNLFNLLSQYGLFIVRTGEVEAWLKHLGVPAKSRSWRSAIFAAMGNNPQDQSYVKPEADDVWDFVGAISKWLADPNRDGIPS